MVMAVEKAKALGVKTLGIAAKEGSPLGEIADLSLEIPWAFDESVCQTRTVTNLYTANLMLLGIIAEDDGLLSEINSAITVGNEYMEKYTPLAKEIAAQDWTKAVVLADSELEGIADEAAIAVTEIAQLPGTYHHVLDVRHGPMVLVDDSTLVIMFCSPAEITQQRRLVADLRGRGAKVVTISAQEDNLWDANWSVTIPSYHNFAVNGIPFIFIPQAISYYKALERGVDPDRPSGLEPWIKLG